MITDDDLRATRPVPRSMQEAFGPYVDDVLQEQRPAPWHKADTIVAVIAALAAVAALVIIAIWG